ncbi:helix-turn-helix domain-containing protein [Hyphobacterium sp. HN65]|uniref:Helix-turn-helix domain-containing protein n=1 Tax=Hyphobacterium lacteum TaxID=3116575 RepID=A0ABU7LPG5_9PROT|nr:helix-turn-helix domain-containing protein [Hyphobacterium sp. HN65]MEE2525792.1 helix-turn-helix domain-containing protein [Hyphobacterium sp. HN65]
MTRNPLALSANLGRLGHCIQFLKDADRRYVGANPLLAGFFGASSASDVIGRRTTDFFDTGIVERYDELDSAVASGRTLIDRFDFTYDHTGYRKWYLYARTQVWKDGEPIVKGISFPLPQRPAADRIYSRLARATDLIAGHLAEPPAMEDLAQSAHCSIAQLERDFRSVLAQSPKQYRARLRVQRAIDAVRSGMPLTDAALEAGYSEHSALSRAFKAFTGLTPNQFRATLPAS